MHRVGAVGGAMALVSPACLIGRRLASFLADEP
jgi:hypothetical protein